MQNNKKPFETPLIVPIMIYKWHASSSFFVHYTNVYILICAYTRLDGFGYLCFFQKKKLHQKNWSRQEQNIFVPGSTKFFDVKKSHIKLGTSFRWGRIHFNRLPFKFVFLTPVNPLTTPFLYIKGVVRSLQLLLQLAAILIASVTYY